MSSEFDNSYCKTIHLSFKFKCVEKFWFFSISEIVASYFFSWIYAIKNGKYSEYKYNINRYKWDWKTIFKLL